MTWNHQKNRWKKYMGQLWKKWMTCGCKLLVKIPFLPLILMAKPSILILPKFKPKMFFFLATWCYWISWLDIKKIFARFWFSKDIHHSSILKLAIEKVIQKSTNAILSSKMFQDYSNNEKNQFVGFVCSRKKGTLLTSFHIHSFVVFHTGLQKNTIVTYILTAQNHIMSNMQDCSLQLMQLIQYWYVSLFSTIITNEFIGEDFNLRQHSMNGYEAMVFDVTQLTQDVEQSLFTIKTNMPIPMLVYGDPFQ